MTRHREDRRQRREDAPSGRSGSTDDRRPGGDRSGSEHGRRDTRRYAYRDVGARESASDQHGRDAGGRLPERAHGGRRRTTRGPRYGSARGGSQRGEDSVQGVSGRVGRQFGDLHGPRPSAGEAAGSHGEEQFAGAAGRSSRDRRYGSRRGHGSQRRKDRRTDPDA